MSPLMIGLSADVVSSVVVLPAPFGPSSATISPGVDVQVEIAHDRHVVVARRRGPSISSSGAVESASRVRVSSADEPRYASMTRGSRLTSSGVPSAIVAPNSIT